MIRITTIHIILYEYIVVELRGTEVAELYFIVRHIIIAYPFILFIKQRRERNFNRHFYEYTFFSYKN